MRKKMNLHASVTDVLALAYLMLVPEVHEQHWQVGHATLFMWNTVNILIYYYSVLICILFLCTNLYSTEVSNCPNLCVGANFFHWRCASSLNHCDFNAWFIAKVANFVLDLVSRVCNLQTTLFQTFSH